MEVLKSLIKYMWKPFLVGAVLLFIVFLTVVYFAIGMVTMISVVTCLVLAVVVALVISAILGMSFRV